MPPTAFSTIVDVLWIDFSEEGLPAVVGVGRLFQARLGGVGEYSFLSGCELVNIALN